MYSLFLSFYTYNNISPNNGTLLNGLLIPKLLNNCIASCSFTNTPHAAHFDDKNGLPLLVLHIFQSRFSVFFNKLNNTSACFYNTQRKT